MKEEVVFMCVVCSAEVLSPDDGTKLLACCSTAQCSSWREWRRTRLQLSLVSRRGHCGPLCGLLHVFSMPPPLLCGASAVGDLKVLKGRLGLCGPDEGYLRLPEVQS